MTKQVTLTIDGKQVTVPDGMLVVDAAKSRALMFPFFVITQKWNRSACAACAWLRSAAR